MKDSAPNVLIADAPQTHAALAACLPGAHLTFASSLRMARYFLHQQSFDAVVAGMRFDGCRILDLLAFVRASPGLRHIPVVCVQAQPSLLPPELHGVVSAAMRTLGASGWVYISGREGDALASQLAQALQHARREPL